MRQRNPATPTLVFHHRKERQVTAFGEALGRRLDIARIQLDSYALYKTVHEVEQRGDGYCVIEGSFIPPSGEYGVGIRLRYAIGLLRELSSVAQNGFLFSMGAASISSSALTSEA